MTIRVLIIDDSATMRAVLAARLSGHPDIQVVGLANNANEGRTAIKELQPDVVTLDIEMPGMNGLDFLDKIMTLRPTPVIIVSGLTQAGSDVTARALALGAVDCYCKTDFSGNAMQDGGKLAGLVRQAAQVKIRRRAPELQQMSAPVRAISAGGGRVNTQVIAIGSSTGGVEALQVLLRGFPEDCPPAMIVQHVDSRFAPAIARTLDSVSPAKVMLAEPDMPMKRGHVYLAPGDDRHMLVAGTNTLHVKLRPGDPISGHRPSVDALFFSVAQRIGRNAIGILLTGMGADGAKGLLAMHQAGAHTIAQDEASCTVFGMPRVAISLGAAGVVAPIGRIAQHAFS
ncbi:chemotaxis-specific protein-glutamate methyltransferase CheB [Novosphingobium sp. FSY-8]|uniref:Protein-glutamate methylesterase/protein-glutamine glutaminase n=1 Tax=Novosphingobium ovatum TaxID=1908523 RepID=A0ABW9XG89_9SPHN|nr:chemotaxis response regulator protein-glutamate methylesterase [Novosphingobium ovatum]NBC37531.1 chemotaxis-specific protein-glutamate methyltransferase CheB [Novosphingobium ovatum]